MLSISLNILCCFQAYLGEGLGPLSWIQKFKVPHPGRLGGQFILKYAMPVVLDWILGGNVGALKQSPNFQPCCRINDIPKHFSMDEFDTFMDDDQALIRAARADWFLLPVNSSTLEEVGSSAMYNSILLDTKPM